MSYYESGEGRWDRSITVEIPHNLDGTKVFTLSGSVSSGNSGTISLPEESFELDWIPQATQIITFPNFTVGDTIDVTLDRKSTNYTNKLELKIGSTSIKTITNVTTSASITLNSTEQAIIYNAIPNATSGTVVLNCTTYNGTNQVGSTVTKNATAVIPPSIIPSFTSLEHTELNTNVKTIAGAYVKILSNIKLSIVGAVGVYSSTIKSYKINYNGVDYNVANVDTGLINWSGNKTVTATITDSRGRTATKTITLNALDYSPPKIDTFIVERCNSNGTLNAMGTYAKITRSGSISSLNSKNQVTIDIYSRAKGATSWGVVKNTVTETVGKTTYGASPVLNPYIVTSSYEFRVDVKDKFNTTTTYFTMSTGQVVMSWGKTGIGVGKIHEQGALDVEGDVYVSGTINGTVTNADTVDGKHASEFALSGHAHSYAPISHTHSANQVTTGSLPVGVKATNSTDYTTSRVRNARFGTTEPTSLANGEIYFMYE